MTKHDGNGQVTNSSEINRVVLLGPFSLPYDCVSMRFLVPGPIYMSLNTLSMMTGGVTSSRVYDNDSVGSRYELVF